MRPILRVFKRTGPGRKLSVVQIVESGVGDPKFNFFGKTLNNINFPIDV